MIEPIQVTHSQVRARQDHGAADWAAGCAGAVPGGAAQGGQGGPAQEEEGEENRVGIVLSFSPVVGVGTPQPLTRGECAPPLWFRGEGAHSLARKGVRESQFRRGDIHYGTLYIYVLCGEEAGRRALAAPCWQEGHHHCPGQDNREGFQG